MKKIPLTQGKFAIVDDEDYNALNQFKWHTEKRYNHLYATRTLRVDEIFPNTSIKMHRQIMSAKGGEFVDHKNGNGLDNRKQNLRLSKTLNGNCQNRGTSKNNTSGYKGVYKTKNLKIPKWIARINAKRKIYYLGIYKDPREAAIVYDSACRILHGEYAKTNKDLGLL